jgi:polyketide synthase PksN
MNIKNNKDNNVEINESELVAIVGMSCRFPGADDYREFYNNLEKELNFVTQLTKEKWMYYGERDETEQNISKFCGQLDNPFRFDNDFFKITNREAAMMDPQQRILLEETWHCIEDSGINLKELQNGKTSVYVGATANDNDLYVAKEKDTIDKFTCSGNFNSILSNRLSFAFGLTGESITLDTACASSLVCLHEAKKALVRGDSDFSIVAGVCLAYHPWRYLSFSKAHMMSLTGQCKAFSGDADGFVQGEGVGVLLLRPLDKAIKDKNHIYGVIRGSAVNHCGSNHTLSAPKVESQSEVITAALEDAQVNPQTITYVEAHGTGTIIGDPIEIEALSKSYRKYTDNQCFCKIGSVKTNIGHLASAAGVASVIKVLLMMNHRTIVKSLFSEYENAMINFDKTPFVLAKKTEEWIKQGEAPRRAGVSAFGFGGVNCHVIIEEYQVIENEVDNSKTINENSDKSIFALSAKSRESMRKMLVNWKKYLVTEEMSKWTLKEICNTLMNRNLNMEYRFATVASCVDEIINNIDDEIQKNGLLMTKEAKWVLQIDDVEKAALTLKKNIKKEYEFKNYIVNSLSQHNMSEIVDKNQFFSATWQKMNWSLYQFMILTYFIKYLSLYDWKPSAVVAYSEIGSWIGKCVSGTLDISVVALLLSGRKQESDLIYSEPECLFIDYENMSCIAENEFSEDYLKWLIQKLYEQEDVYVNKKDSEDVIEYYKNKCKSLMDNQVSFRNEINKWNGELDTYGLSVESLISSCQENLQMSSNNMKLLIVIMESVLKKLNRKWNLKGDSFIKCPYLNELITCAESGFISKDEIIELFLGSDRQYDKIAHNLNSKCLSKKTFVCLHQYCIEKKKNVEFIKFHKDDFDELIKTHVGTDFNSYIIGVKADRHLSEGVEFDSLTDAPCEKNLVDLWSRGANIKLCIYDNERVFRKATLPTYCYAGKVYPVIRNKVNIQKASLCPIIDENISDFSFQKFRKTITGNEFYINEHFVHGKKTMPYAGYVEMAGEAGYLSFGEKVTRIENLVVERSFVIEDGEKKDLYIQLNPLKTGAQFVIYDVENERQRVYSKGILYSGKDVKTDETQNIKEIISDFKDQSSVDAYYDFIGKIGITYGKSFHTIKAFWEKDTSCLSEIELSPERKTSANEYELHPAIIDGALQSVIRLIGNRNSDVVYLPHMTSEISIYKELPEKCLIYAVKNQNSSTEPPISVDIYICNEQGEVCVFLNSFTAKALINKKRRVKLYEERICSQTTIDTNYNDIIKSLNVVVVGTSMMSDIADALAEKGLPVENIKSFPGDKSDFVKETYDFGNLDSKNLCIVIQGEKSYESIVWKIITLGKRALSNKKIENVLVLAIYDKKDYEIMSCTEALAGFGRTIAMENPVIQVRSVGFHLTSENDLKLITAGIIREIELKKDCHHNIVYTNTDVLKRNVWEYSEFSPVNRNISCIRERGNYVISGAGGLGMLFAEYFSQKGALNVYLLGRSLLSAEKQRKIDELNNMYESNIYYVQTDITNEKEFNRAIDYIYSKSETINGVLQCAGVLKDSFFWLKEKEEIALVLEPKIEGTKNLFNVFREKSLDFFVLFSSMAAAIGSIGQCDYSYANSYLDSFARVHKDEMNTLVSVQWPLWKDGGMTLDEKNLTNLKEIQGLDEISKEEGFEIFEQAVSSRLSGLLALKGDEERFKNRFDRDALMEHSLNESENSQVLVEEGYEIAKSILIDIFAKEIGVSADEIDTEREFSYYGIDSGMITDLNIEIERVFSEPSKTLFFEYFNISEMAKYLGSKYAVTLKQNLQIEIEGKENSIADISINNSQNRFFIDELSTCDQDEELYDEIAIIGLAGQYPESDDIKEFWNAIENGKDCIREIPEDRWDNEKYYLEKGDGYYCKWGGWLSDVDKFDPMFFHISPREAEAMDPQERLFLMNTWRAMEDAGYRKNEMQKSCAGVFVGVMYGTYSMEAVEETVKGNTVTVGLSHASIANRVSYALNLNGPSIAIDTMCSSSITAIHLACESLRNKECEMAIAGGVNVMTHPQKYLYLSKGNFLSTEGKCRSFGEGGDGYVPGEGVGVVILKPLKAAIRDRDHIYGVVKSTAINHGGKTNGFTVPNPRAQEKVIREGFERAHIAPETIGYIEAHGTGTALGDPIEITALKNAFGNQINAKIPMGSVKSNIGHLESAAGIAAVTKVLLQFMHKKIVPSIHSEVLNHNIHFDATPFVVQKDLIEWERKKVYCDGKYDEVPRRACISAFGAGGSNAYMILEEYDEVQQEIVDQNQQFLFVLSGATQNAVRQISSQLINSDWLNCNNDLECNNSCLGDIAYTLCNGREELEERVAFVCDSLNKLCTILSNISRGEYEGIYVGSAEGKKVIVSQEKVNKVLVARDLEQIAKLWVQGVRIDITEVFENGNYKKISLPTYPFELQRYYISRTNNGIGESLSGTHSISTLLDANLSNIYEVKFEKTFSIDEFFVKDHEIAGKHLVPGAVFVEMARQAGELAINSKVSKINNIVFADSLPVEQNVVSQVILEHINGGVDYKILAKEENRILGRGSIAMDQVYVEPGNSIDVQGIMNRLDLCREAEEIQKLFQLAGFGYGKSMTAMNKVWYGENTALAYLKLPECLGKNTDYYGLHPSLLDAAFGTVMQIGEHSKEIEKGVRVPFSIDKIYIYGDLPSECYCFASLVSKNSSISKYDITIVDIRGNVLVNVHNFVARLYEHNKKSVFRNEKDLYYYKTGLYESSGETEENSFSTVMVIGYPNSNIVTGINEKYNCVQVSFKDHFDSSGDKKYCINPKNEEHYKLLLQQLDEKQIIPSKILYFDKAKENNVDINAEFLSESLDEGIWMIMCMVKAYAKIAPRNNVQFKYFYRDEENSNPVHGLISGLANSMQGINGYFVMSCIGISHKYDSKYISEIVMSEICMISKKEREIRYVDGKRYVQNIVPTKLYDSDFDNTDLCCCNGVYLIVGGLGKIGRIVTKAIVSRNNVQLILTGRRELTLEDRRYIDGLKKNGSSVEYVVCDISDSDSTLSLSLEIRKKYTKINCVINCAGSVGKRKAVDVSHKEFRKDVSSKVFGLYNLDNALGDMQIDSMLLFSSISGRIGDFGLGSYGAVSRFMDYFAMYRNELVSRGIRKGKTISIDWPFWIGGGMKLPENQKKLYYGHGGFSDLQDEDGIKALVEIMHCEIPDIIVACGDKNKIDKALGIVNSNENYELDSEQINVSDEKLIFGANEYLKAIFSEITRYPKDKIRTDKDIDYYGIDSVMISEFNEKLGKDVSNLSSALLFEYTTLNDLAIYLVNEYTDEMIKILENNGYLEKKIDTDVVYNKMAEKIEPVKFNMVDNSIYAKDDIAIVGISGRFPEAENVEEFWENLVNGKDCIIEIPDSRWDYKKYYTPKKNIPGKIYSKWGGFLRGAKEFDPLFFGISPKDARRMDPQERLFLETAWECIEDAGYSRESMSGKKVGVFVGAMYASYQMEVWENTKMEFANSFFSAIANRVSYTMNFTGPSLALDTACSSSLEAIRIACCNIWDGSCQSAIAGGVNLSLHPEKYLFLCQNGFLSIDGRCRSFGVDGDGYVPGEGVGALLLKPLSQAVKDGDHIYGVIKSAVVNHGGKTRGYTVPNPGAQERLIVEAIESANIPVESIGYFEMHGTGTALGDPIEVDSLCNAIKKCNGNGERYAIGSVKSNIGHLESAAGIAAIIKVLLQMKYRKLVPSIHAEQLNPGISFDKLPVYVQRKYEDWVPKTNPNSSEVYPLRAGISAFGAGGTNVHIIVEEYVAKRDVVEERVEIIPLSAKNEVALKDSARRLIKYLERYLGSNCIVDSDEKIENKMIKIFSDVSGIDMKYINSETIIEELGLDYVQRLELSEIICKEFNVECDITSFSQCVLVEDIERMCYGNQAIGNIEAYGCASNQIVSLADIAYTLQVGRTHYETRTTFVVSTLKDLLEKLKLFASDSDANESSVYIVNKEESSLYVDVDIDRIVGESVADEYTMKNIAYKWCLGGEIDWEKLNANRALNRVSLPTYPFDNKQYVIEKDLTDSSDDTYYDDVNVYSDSINYSKNNDILSWIENFQNSEISEEEMEELLEAYLNNDESL